ncbi:MAG: fumarate hydratase [Geminicoccaceae bacterium]
MDTIIKGEDLVRSVADALQFISYHHPADYIRHLAALYEREESLAAKDAMAQILVNSRMAALGKRPICQDTGTAVAFLKIGMGVRFDTRDLFLDLINEGVRRPIWTRTIRCVPRWWPILLVRPCQHPGQCAGHRPHGAGAGRHARGHRRQGRRLGEQGQVHWSSIRELIPVVVDWVLKTAPTLGPAGARLGMLGPGIGGTPEKAMLMAKESLLAPVDMAELPGARPASKRRSCGSSSTRRPTSWASARRAWGGLTTVVDVKLKTYPCHAASLPVGLIPQCAASHHVHFTLDGSGPAQFDPLDLRDWPRIALERTRACRAQGRSRPALSARRSQAGSRARRSCSRVGS